MHKQSLVILHQQLQVCPSKIWTIIGVVTKFERELKRTVINIQTVDYSKTENNVDSFEVIFYGDTKTLADKTLSVGDLIHCTGEMKGITINKIELQCRWFLSWSGLKNSFESTKAISSPEIIDPTLAY